MGLNIKNERVHDLARRLSNSTGKTMTAVIEQALEEKLARLSQDRGVPEKVRWLESRLKKLGPPAAELTSEHDDLYDDRGLPK